MTEKQIAWAESHIGKSMRPQIGGERGIVTGYEPAKNGKGCWFHLTTTPTLVYKRFPVRLQKK